jgi:hypothetical protein
VIERNAATPSIADPLIDLQHATARRADCSNVTPGAAIQRLPLTESADLKEQLDLRAAAQAAALLSRREPDTLLQPCLAPGLIKTE